jgi:hypothetical protein
MHRRIIRLSSFIVIFALATVISAQPTTQPADGTRGPRTGERGQRGAGIPQNVEGAMKGVNRAMRQLRKQIGDASKKDENLKLIGDMERNAVIAKNMPLPDDYLEKAKTDEDRAKLKADYRNDLMKLVRDLLDMEQNVIDGKNDVATKQLDEVQKLRESSHEKLGVKEDERDK